jgi:SAM-dependent methyltransferase
VTGDRAQRMRAYWDERARLNAAWYVDTTLDYDHPDMAQFFASGERIVDEHYLRAPVHPARTGRAVEIGSGLGRICRALRRHFDEVIGLDISPRMVAQAGELVQDDGITFRVSDGTTLRGVEDASVDLVFTFTVFQHIPDPAIVAGYLAEAGRVLRAGGLLVFQWNNQPNPTWWRLRRAALSTLQRSRLRPETFGRNAPEFLGARIPLPDIRAALGQAGLQLHSVEGQGTLFCWGYAVRLGDPG